MDYLKQRNLIKPPTRKNFLGNRLVIAAPADSDLKLDIKPGFDLVGALKGGHLAMADPDSVPAGKYGKAALEKLGVWSSVRAAVAPAENVRAALLFVSRREAPLGIVYATDAAAGPRGKIAGVFPEDTHPPIIYPAALTARIRTRPGCSNFSPPRRHGRYSKSGVSLCFSSTVGQRSLGT